MNANFYGTNGKISWFPCTTCINEDRTLPAVQCAADAAGRRALRQLHGCRAATVSEPERREPAYPADRGVFRLRAVRAPYADGGADRRMPAARADRRRTARYRAPLDAHSEHGRPDRDAARYADAGRTLAAAAPARLLCRSAGHPA